LCSSSDKDYFKFELEDENPVNLTLTVPSETDYDLYLYDSSEYELDSSRTTEGTETITYDATETGMYYIQVFGYSGSYDKEESYILAGTWTATVSPSPTPAVTPTTVQSPVPSPTEKTTPSPIPRETPAEKEIVIGSVVDAISFSPIAEAVVLTDSGEYTATTNPAGRYVIPNIQAGEYTLTASAGGYEPSSLSVTVYPGSQPWSTSV